MKKATRFIVVIAAVLITAGSAFAHLPKIQVLVLDASGSIPAQEFEKQKVAAVKFLHTYHERAKIYPELRSDWIAVTFFGGDDEFSGTEFVKCDDSADVLATMDAIARFPHPSYGNTAIYTAIAKATMLCAQKDQTLPGNYMKNLIVVTDGQDNSSDSELKQFVKSSFPNLLFNLFVVGVGGSANIREFEPIADATMPLNSFDQLIAALLLLGDIAD
jgi:hypothetical protein